MDRTHPISVVIPSPSIPYGGETGMERGGWTSEVNGVIMMVYAPQAGASQGRALHDPFHLNLRSFTTLIRSERWKERKWMKPKGANGSGLRDTAKG